MWCPETASWQEFVAFPQDCCASMVVLWVAQVQSTLAEVAEGVVPSVPACDCILCQSPWNLLHPAAKHSAAKRELVAKLKLLDQRDVLPDAKTAASFGIEASFCVWGSSISLHLMEPSRTGSIDSLHCPSSLFGSPSASHRSPNSARKCRRTMPVGISFCGRCHIASHWSQLAPFLPG